MAQLRQRMLEELQRRNYSSETIRGYIFAVRELAEHYNKSPEQMGAEELRHYQVHLLQKRKLAPGTVEIRISALRFLFKKVLKRRDLAFDDLVFPKTPKKLPVVLSHEEVNRLIEAAPNLLYRTIWMILYGTGLRRAEVVHLKVSDIDSQRMVIRVRQGKGARDRDVPMSAKLLEALREYWRWNKPKEYLFPSSPGHRGLDQPASDKTVWNACQTAAKRAGLRKPIGAHTAGSWHGSPHDSASAGSLTWKTPRFISICRSNNFTPRSTRSIRSPFVATRKLAPERLPCGSVRVAMGRCGSLND